MTTNAQIETLIAAWRQAAIEAQGKTRGLRGAEGQLLSSYYEGYADALVQCAQELQAVKIDSGR